MMIGCAAAVSRWWTKSVASSSPSGFIDHCGRLDEYTLTDGTRVRSHIRRPHTFYLGELFKIDHGMICQIEANFITVPYHTPSPWDGR